MTALRTASWNLQSRSGDGAVRLGSLPADRGGADLVLVQEASVSGLPMFCEAAGIGSWVHIRRVGGGGYPFMACSWWMPCCPKGDADDGRSRATGRP